MLKLIGEKMAIFKVVLKARWDKEDTPGNVVVLIEDEPDSKTTMNDDEDEGEEGSEMEE